ASDTRHSRGISSDGPFISARSAFACGATAPPSPLVQPKASLGDAPRLAGQLAINLSLDAAHLGLLTSVYFLAFAAVQLPVGAALDHYGPRWVQSALLLLAAAGAALFASASSFPGL
ncbi:MAG TPA: MFS transporter, partial [Stellaceae bacterium]|nr:MFS transporter [Stellaceae bacterium]